MEPRLKKQGLTWDGVLPIFEDITVTEIQLAIEDFEGFLGKMAVGSASAPPSRANAMKLVNPTMANTVIVRSKMSK
mgnify:CR=1 FL=1